MQIAQTQSNTSQERYKADTGHERNVSKQMYSRCKTRKTHEQTNDGTLKSGNKVQRKGYNDSDKPGNEKV